MQVTDHIHALKIPFQITAPDGRKRDRFVYAYLIYGEEVCLIDSGIAHSERIIADYLQKTGRAINDITLLVLTHSHPDHIGSAAAIKRLSGCTVAAHAAERAWIENIDLQEKERPVPGFGSLVGGSIAVDWILEDGDILDLKGGLELQVLHTPGHSAGSISLWQKQDRALFAADAIPVFGDMPIYQDIDQSLRSIQRLDELDGVEVLLSAWDDPRKDYEAHRAIAGGRRYLQSIHECVQRVIGENPDLRVEPMKLCSRVLDEMGLPAIMSSPLVAASFLSSLKSCSSQQREREKDSGCLQ